MANRLIDEQSPYLLQHAHNPVDWYPWGDEAFKRAKNENKPVIVSIGYAACHWCHVMERESFESDEVAAYMNEHFVCIKVDREEHPGVDQMYMDAIQAISGSGGWPLNVFATPDRLPFYGGTYYPPKPMYGRLSWMQLLQRMQEVWSTQPAEVTAQTEQMLGYLKQVSQQAMVTARVPYDLNTVNQMAEALLKQADIVNGGFGGAPKFPGTMAIGFLLDNYALTGNEAALAQAVLSLDKMLFGGIYDQIGGGFARYATDEKWLVPHFEKMLYDNALLVSVLCDAYMLTGNAEYRRIIEETIAFAERELKDPSGIYYSAIDADSEGVEGKFYTWSAEEWMQVTGNDEAVALYFDISPEGNWEHTNIPNVPLGLKTVAERTGRDPEQLQKDIDAAKQKLFLARAKRVRPITDDKSLLSWNALMNIALSKAAVVLQNTSYLQLAEAHMQRMTECFGTDAGLMHVWKAGRAKIAANLDDYAYLISAMLQLASAGGNNGHIVRAAQLNEEVMRLFLHEHGHFFYYTPAGAADIPVRKVETYDGATPSSNAVMAHNLYLLGLCMERTDWAEMAEYMVAQTVPAATRYAYSYGYWCRLAQISAHGGKLVVASGGDAYAGIAAIPGYHPQAYVLTLQKEIFDVPALSGKFSSAILKYHVCTQSACLPPVSAPEAVLPLIKKSK